MCAFDFLARQEITYDNLANFIETKEFNDIVKGNKLEIEAKKYKWYIYTKRKEIKLKNLKN